jgi:hypothetical protein
VAWICPLLQPLVFEEQEYIFFEGDDVGGLFFLTKGECNFVLPKHNNLKYLKVEEGLSFGLVDIIGSTLQNGLALDEWFNRKDLMKRQFSNQANRYVEVMNLTLQDLRRI